MYFKKIFFLGFALLSLGFGTLANSQTTTTTTLTQSSTTTTTLNTTNNLTPEELAQVNYLLNTYDCDLNKDKVCDSKDIKLQQQQFQQQQQQNAQAGQIAQQLLGQVLGGLLGGGGGGGGGGGNIRPPNNPVKPKVPESIPGQVKPPQIVRPPDDRLFNNHAPTPSAEEIDPSVKELFKEVGTDKQNEAEDTAGETEKRELPTTTTTSVSTTSTTVKEKNTKEEIKESNKFNNSELREIEQQYYDQGVLKAGSLEANKNMAAGQPAAVAVDKYLDNLSAAVDAGKIPLSAAQDLYREANLMAHFKTSSGALYNGLSAPGEFNLQSQIRDINGVLTSQSQFLQNTNFEPNAVKLAQQQLLNAADVSTIKQFGGTCFTCAAIQTGLYTDAAKFVEIQNTLYQGGSYNGISKQTLGLSGASTWSPLNGQAGFADQVNTGIVALKSGGSIQGGGYSNNAVSAVAGIVGHPLHINPSTANYSPQSQLNFINSSYPVEYTLPFNGHNASYSSIVSTDANGVPIKYVKGDNSYSPVGKFHEATAANAGKLTYPGGLGGSGPGGGFNPLAFAGLGNGFNNGGSNPYQQNANAKEDAKKKEQLKNEYNKLTQAQKDKIIDSCVQIGQANNGFPSVCIVAAESLTASNSTTSGRVSRTSSSARIDVDLLKF